MEEAKLTVIKWVFVGPPLSLLALLLTYELKEEVILCNSLRVFSIYYFWGDLFFISSVIKMGSG